MFPSDAFERINLRTSLLEDATAFKPFVELMTDEKLPWVDVPAEHSFEGRPASLEELQALMDDYS